MLFLLKIMPFVKWEINFPTLAVCKTKGMLNNSSANVAVI